MDDLVERVAKAMYEAPAPGEPDAAKTPWPPAHPDDLAWWISRAQVAINTIAGPVWAEGALWAAVECGAIRDETERWLAPGDNPYTIKGEP
ncbi:hypothetical protein QEH34_gp42 [Microbacterium phage Footloose]|uniref:Uncharacterized protein n=1 Tax=Microbacterium phage Footloose TaxID=2836048 RepID=A0A8F3IPZ4_9CAUD|nr:hypothetical protein QEH34_gp42 [Microbacterium phage Footloose]QWY84624.1 hypothetical protein SEA_FOOTLOOSE_42 [Microbacterium phage Footloose]